MDYLTYLTFTNTWMACLRER